MAITKPFDEHLDEYENWFEINRFAYESELRAIKALLSRNGRAMEIGVGSGKLAEPLRIRLGIEPSVRMREVYRVIKKGGCMIIGFVDKTSTIGKLYQEHKDQSVFCKPATLYLTGEVIGFLEQAAFSRFSFVQTIFHSLAEVKAIEPVRKGYGSGSFVVVKAVKQHAGPRPNRSRAGKHRLLNNDESPSRSNDRSTV